MSEQSTPRREDPVVGPMVPVGGTVITTRWHRLVRRVMSVVRPARPR